jgi:hypothetical protein
MMKFEEFISAFLGVNWRTSLAAIVSSIAAFIVLNPQFVHNEFVIKAAEFIGIGGLSALGINARDRQTGVRGMKR